MRRPLHVCSTLGCSVLVPHGTYACPQHQRAKYKAQDRQRGSSHDRGYGADWRRWRASIVAQHDLIYCGDRPPGAPQTEDSVCLSSGKRIFGDDLDHIVPFNGKDDPRRFDETNVQLLCDRPPNYCHQRKRRRESEAATPGRS